MNTLLDTPISNEVLFKKLFAAQTESEVEEILLNYSEIFSSQENWRPLGKTDNNYAIVKNQQANPIAALIEKITNSIDAILMKKALEQGVDPKAENAPQSMDEAVKSFFPDFKNWDLPTFRKAQAEDIQIVADGPPRDTSVIIYDNGEGQHPEDFESTFLSLIRGNKKNIHFVQGKYVGSPKNSTVWK